MAPVKKRGRPVASVSGSNSRASSQPANKRARFDIPNAEENTPRRSTRVKDQTASPEKKVIKKLPSAPAQRGRGRPPKSVPETQHDEDNDEAEVGESAPKKKPGRSKGSRSTRPAMKNGKNTNTSGRKLSIDIPKAPNPEATTDDGGMDEDFDEDRPQYWLMKAEPDSRIEKGKDVKFSIDDLKNATEPEGWDGVRNYVARNVMRAMKKGDLAFFYHSNCKVPGIAGLMEIAEEHSIDESAFDESHPYFDAKSTREKPKWDKVRVKFVRKFPELVKLSLLRSYAQTGGVLENMQMLRMGRLSVSSVSPKEWDFIMSLVEGDEGEAEDPANGEIGKAADGDRTNSEDET